MTFVKLLLLSGFSVRKERKEEKKKRISLFPSLKTKPWVCLWALLKSGVISF